MNYLEGTRSTEIRKVRVFNIKRDDLLFPRAVSEREDVPDEVWHVMITVKAGLLPEQTRFLLCETEAEVSSALERFKVGQVFPDKELLENRKNWAETVRTFVDAKLAPSAGNAGDDDSSLAFDVLRKAELYTLSGSISEHVQKWLGEERIEKLRAHFGENWKVAGVFEYCWATLPSSSPAHLAALYQFLYYICEDDFAAGYYWRDLEVIVHGVEATAITTKNMRENAGKAGSEKSAQARKKRRVSLLDAMEMVAARNPDIVALGEEALCTIALRDCLEQAPALWSQGKGQAGEYLGEIRRGEAGKSMQGRYLRLFPPKAPKRS